MTISDKRSLDSRRALPSYPSNTQAPVPRNSRERREATACSDAESCIPTTEQAWPYYFKTPLPPSSHDGYRDCPIPLVEDTPAELMEAMES